MINDRIKLLSGHSSAGYAVVTAIKTVAILFVIILAIQGVFHLPYYFCGLCGYFVVGTNPREFKEETSSQELSQKEQTYGIFAVLNSLVFAFAVAPLAVVLTVFLSIAWSDGIRKTRTQEDEERARKRRGEALSLLGDSKSTPYLWQFKEADSNAWKNFGPSDNVVLEELYCNVNNVEVEIELEDTTIRNSRKLSGKMSANFHTMSMSLFSPFNHFLIRRRSTPSYIKEHGNKLPTLWVWYWEDIDGWKKYAETNLCSGAKQEQIEASYLNGDPAYYFQIGGNDYVIHFEGTLMNQRSVDPEVQAVRLVRRRPMSASNSAPQTTVSNPKGQVMAVERTNLKKDTEEYRTVRQHFHKTMPEHRASIVMVEKITNGHLLQKYERKCQEMREQRKSMREKWLFHGTTSDVVDAICTRNFDHRVCGKNGTKYGQGSYFAVDASYSNYYSKTGVEKTRYMFLTKVLTGEFIRGKQEFRRPPLKDPSNLAGDLYDSCVDDENLPKIFVIFDNEQCYPSYLIKYYLK